MADKTEHIEWTAEESLALVLRIKNLPGTERRVDPFQEAVPCWQDGKVWPWTNEPHPLEVLASRMGNSNAFRK